MSYYSIYYNGRNFELWIDGVYVNSWRTWPDAKAAAERRGAVRRPMKVESDEGAPF